MKVVIIGPNLPARLADKGTFHVHAEGCRDILIRYPKDLTDCEPPVEVETQKAAVEIIYDNGILDESVEDMKAHTGRTDTDKLRDEMLETYVRDFYFAPCLKDLPYMIEAIEASERGANWLDEHYPGWFKSVPEDFDMGSYCGCVGAHVDGRQNTYGTYSTFREHNGLSINETIKLGFELDKYTPYGYEELTQAWQDRIAERLVAWQPNYTE